jgi:hypothetical protein
MTSENTGERILRRSVAVTTDIDRLLPRIESELQEAAEEAEGGTVRVPNFPLPVDLSVDEARTLEGADLRDRILAEAADRLYDEGTSAWAGADPAAEQDIGRLSAAGLMSLGLGLIQASTHNLFVIASVLLGIISLGLAALLLLSVRWHLRLIALGGATMIAALPPLAAAVGLRFVFRTAATDADPFVEGLLEIGVDAMWVPIRNYLTLTILGFAVIAVSTLFLWWHERVIVRAAASADTGS